jgi:Protein of unknown function (DUF3800)
MFVAYVDESGKGEPIFVVGALTATTEQWNVLSEEWLTTLRAAPEIPAFHLSDRQGLSRDEHNRKIDGLIPIINARVARGDLNVVMTDVYRALYQRMFSATMDSPFHFAYVATFQQCAIEIPDPDSKIDFVFDEMDRTQHAELLHAFDSFRAACPSEDVKRRFNAVPALRDDVDTPPLQAADLWAGIMRRATVTQDEEAKARLRQFTITNRAFLWDENTLLEHWRRQIERTPELLTGKLYEDRKGRSNRLKSVRARLLGGGSHS